MIPYRTEAGPITSAQFNVLVGAAREKLRTMLRGLAPALAFPTGQPIPPELLGFPVFHNDGGPTPFSKLFPGYIPRQGVVDGLPVEFARAYDHTPFLAAEASLALQSQDDTDHIAVVADAGNSYFTNGQTRPASGVSLMDICLCALGRLITPPGGAQPVKYYLRERNQRTPAKVNRLGVVEHIIENKLSLTLPTDTVYPTVVASGWENQRFWNLQRRACPVTNLGVVLPPFSCVCVRRTWNDTTHQFEDQRVTDYFFDHVVGDLMAFASFASTPLTGSNSSTLNDTAIWAGGSIQGNNVANLAVLLDWVRVFASRTNLYAQLLPDVHELCDMAALNPATMAAKHACLDAETGTLKPNAKVGDFFHTTGKVRVAQVHKTQHAPAPNADKFVEAWDEVTFTGYHDFPALVAAFAAKGIAVIEVAGVLQLKNQSSAWSLDLIHWQSNCLKNVDHGGQAQWYVLRQGANIDSGYLLETKVYENTGALGQDALGYQPFNLAATSSYKLTPRQITSSARSRTYRNPAGQNITVPGVPLETISEVAPEPNAEPPGIHAASVLDWLGLKWIRNVALPTQEDVEITDSRFTLTPQGWVLTFTESVRADVMFQSRAPVRFVTNNAIVLSGGQRFGSVFTAEGDRVAVGRNGSNAEGIYIVSQTGAWTLANDNVVEGTQITVSDGPEAGQRFALTALGRWTSAGGETGDGTTDYVNQFGRALEFSEGRFVLKHKVWFRKHGLGFHHLGRIHASCHTPFNGRLIAPSWTREISGPDGADLAPPGDATETDVKIARTLGPADYTAAFGGRLFGSTGGKPLDSLLALGRNYGTPFWYQTRYPAIIGNIPREQITEQAASATGRTADVAGNSQVFTATSNVQFNLVAEVLNQCKAAHALDWRCLRLVQGAHVLDFNTANGEAGIAMWQELFGGTPAPLNAALGIKAGADAALQAAWRALFTELGVTEATGTAVDLPASWNTYRTEWNQNRNVTTTFTGQFLNPFVGAVRGYYRFGLAPQQTWTPYHATLRVNAAATLGAASNALAQGNAAIALPGNAGTVALGTAYANLKWLTWDSLSALVGPFGFEVGEVEEFVPLSLDVLEASENLRSTDGQAATGQWDYTGEVTGLVGVNAARDTFMLACIPATVIHPLSFTSTILSRRIAFRLHGQAEDTGAPEWKLPVATTTPPTVYQLNTRSPGRAPAHQWHRHVGVVFNSISPFGSGSAGSGIMNFGAPVGAGLDVFAGVGHLLVPPWHGPDGEYAWPNAALPGPFALGLLQTNPGNGAQATPWSYNNGTTSLVAVLKAAMFTLSIELAAPTTNEGLRRVQNMQRWAGQEQFWIASRVIGSGAKEYRYIPQPAWSKEIDWWRASDDAFLQHVLVGPNPVPRDVPAVSDPDSVEASALTYHRPVGEGAIRVIYSPRSRPVVALQ